MTTVQILREFESLPRAEQEYLARVITGSLHGNGAGQDLSEARRARRQAAAQSLHGILRGDGPAPTDEDIRHLRDAHLMEKYG